MAPLIRFAKPSRNSVDPMSSDEIDLAAIAETLAKSPDYRVLRRLAPRTEFASCQGQVSKVGILLDVETTGLNTAHDAIIELAMVKFDYLPDDRIARVTGVLSSFNEPSNPIPGEITELTDITDEMVSGHRIDPAAVSSFASSTRSRICIDFFAEMPSRSSRQRDVEQQVKTPDKLSGFQRPKVIGDRPSERPTSALSPDGSLPKGRALFSSGK
jgi:hypothetical protein